MAEKVWVIIHRWGPGAEAIYMVRCPCEPEEQEAAAIINKYGGPYEPEREEYIAVEEAAPIYDLKMNRTRRVVVPRYIYEGLEVALKNNLPVENVGDGEVAETFTADFGGGYEVDIKVVSSDDGAWIDAVLFLGGCDYGALEPSFDSIFGEYIFEDDGHEFTVMVEPEQEAT